MNRRGFALLTTLWLIVALAALGATTLATARRRGWTGRNRIWLRRTEWAREACFSIVRARYRVAANDAGDDAAKLAALPPAELPRIELGRGAWCSARLEHPERRVNLNLADASLLAGLLGRADLVDALLDWRDPDDLPRPNGAEREWYRLPGRSPPRNGPLASWQELRQVRGFDSATVARLAPYVTMQGDGRLDLNAAPIELVRLLPGVTPELAEWIARQRGSGHRIGSLRGTLPAALGPGGGDPLRERGRAPPAGAVRPGPVLGDPRRASRRGRPLFHQPAAARPGRSSARCSPRGGELKCSDDCGGA